MLIAARPFRKVGFSMTEGHDRLRRIATAIDELRETVRSLERDPSPHAPEVPFSLAEDLTQLFMAAYGVAR